MLNRVTLTSYGFTEHAFTRNGYVDALQQEAAYIKTFCRLRSTSFSKTVGSHESSLQVERWRIALTVLITMHIIRYTLYTLGSRPQDILLLARYLHAHFRVCCAKNSKREYARALISVVPRVQWITSWSRMDSINYIQLAEKSTVFITHYLYR